MVGSLIFGIFSLVFCVVFCFLRARKANVTSLMFKILSSVCFILCGLFALKQTVSTNFNLLVIAGLVMGLIGDILLDLKIMYPEQNDTFFTNGTASFAIGHIFYFVAVAFYNDAVLASHLGWNILAAAGVGILMTAIIMLLSKPLNLNFGKHKYTVAVYSFLLTFMMAYSIAIAIFNPIFWIFAGGMIAFFLSDLVLSMQYFGGRGEKVWIFVNHILYYLAQSMLAFSILYLVF